jgi:hypothetical protein
MRKSFHHYTIMAVVAVLLISCSKQLDSVSPRDAVSEENLTAADIALLRSGMYNRMEDAVYAAWFDFDVKGENFASGPGFSLVDPMNMTTTSPEVAGIWRSTFTNLLQPNFLIESIDNLGNNATAIQRTYKGEALYFRALLYYNLVTRYGGVPIITKKNFEPVQRSTEQETWAQIVSDLKSAEELTGAFTDRFYVSKPAVQALLAKVYLAQKQYDSVITYANKIIATGRFSLATDSASFAAIFFSGSTSRELIFALANNTVNSPHLFYQQVNDVDGSWNYSPSPGLYTSLYADNTIGGAVRSRDKRRSAVFFSNNSRVTKFPNSGSGQQSLATPAINNANQAPIVVSRYADVLLMLAEAQSMSPNSSISAAAATLNPYFINRYNTPPAQASVVSLSAVDFQNLILNERRREFYGEGQWWYDVKRTNRLNLFSSLAGRNYLMLYPIPQTERDLAGYTQNPGY